MTVRVRDLSAIRRVISSLVAFSVGFEGVYQGIVLTPQAILASGGIPPYSFAAVGLPTGVAIDPVTGIISGTPAVFGSVTATVTVTDNAGNSINVPAFFSILQTAFSDDFNRANSINIGSDWARLLGGNDSVSPDSWATGAIETNQLAVRGRGPNNPNSTLFTGFSPFPVMLNLFNLPKVFAQVTFGGFIGVGASGGLALRVNQSAEAGPITNNQGFDSYICVVNGRLDRQFNGGAAATIGANTVAIVAGNVLRIEAENVGTSTIVTTYVNAVQVNQVTVLAAAFPIQRGYPSLLLTSVAGAPPTGNGFIWDNFSCGVF
jgi:hypothetical protein